MALPELVKLAVEKSLSEYCRRKAPRHISDQFRLDYRFRGATVTLLESRPCYHDRDQWTESAIAQFRFDQANGEWTLHWPDRNSRWHCCTQVEPSKNFVHLLQKVDSDPSGIFWG